MSQHDFDIANQSAPNFRSDLNNALGALASLSSGATAPSTTYANMLWYDTANNILKMRNEADDAWINFGYVNQGDDTFAVLEGTKIRNTSGTEVGTIGTGDFVLLETQTASASATLDFTAFDNSTYSTYFFVLDAVLPQTNDVALWVRTSTNGGSTFDSGATDYNGNSAQATIAARIDTSSGDGVMGEVKLFSAPTTKRTYIQFCTFHFDVFDAKGGGTGVGFDFNDTIAYRGALADVDAVRFLMSSGNIASGTIKMYGLV